MDPSWNRALPNLEAAMSDREPNIVPSALSRTVKKGGSDEEANAEFERTVAKEGMQAFLDKSNVIPFRR